MYQQRLAHVCTKHGVEYERIEAVIEIMEESHKKKYHNIDRINYILSKVTELAVNNGVSPTLACNVMYIMVYVA